MDSLHKKSLMREINLKPKDDKVISLREFDQRIANGEYLVIFDEYVLDVTDFMWQHPGGTFSLRYNIGRDISKFWHGGYSLENLKPCEHHAHSPAAKRIVNDLIIGYLIEKPATRMM